MHVSRGIPNHPGLWILFVSLVLVLSACASDPITVPNPAPDPAIDPSPISDPVPENRVLEYDLCPEALELPEGKRMYQGYDGWFFFRFDLEEHFSIFDQTDFVVELSQALKTQGVSLVVMPIPARGVVRPNFIYPGDPTQRAFSSGEAEASYNNYVKTLRRAGVGIVDVLAAAKTFDAGGGQTFFKRDLHWTPEGTNAVAQETAKVVEQVANHALPRTGMRVVRRPENDKLHRGAYLGDWLNKACGYLLPPELLKNYEVIYMEEVNGVPETVLAGSSFSRDRFDHGFLGAALQSEVLNVSVGAGGAKLALESYLTGDDYANHKPEVIVWEWAVYTGSLGEASQRQLLGAAYGKCSGNAKKAERVVSAGDSLLMRLDQQILTASEHYINFSFDDLSILDVDATLSYQDGAEETLEFRRADRIASKNQGYYSATLADNNASLKAVKINLPNGGRGRVRVQICQIPLTTGTKNV